MLYLLACSSEGMSELGGLTFRSFCGASKKVSVDVTYLTFICICIGLVLPTVLVLRSQMQQHKKNKQNIF